MSIENQEIAEQFIKEHFEKIQKFITSFALNNNLSEVERDIIQKISDYITDFFKQVQSNIPAIKYLHFCLSHLDVLLHNIKLKMGVSVSLPQKPIDYLQNLIDKAYIFIGDKNNLEQPKKQSENTVLSRGFILDISLSSDEEYRKEKELSTRQKHIYIPHAESIAFKHFLKAVWRYAIENKISSKKIFISYAWPIGNVHQEKWTKLFITSLTKNLCDAGLQVYMDEIHGGPGMFLRKFMKKIQQMDHVLVINSRTMQIKLRLDASGVKYEADRIKECVKEGQKNSDFIINILLNNNLYSHETFHQYPYVSFFNQGYLEGLKQLISGIYGFDPEKFNQFWIYQIELHKVTGHLWNVKSPNPFYLHRRDLAKELENNLFQQSNKNSKIICYGKEGTGKTELIRHYINENYAKYKAIYWFNAFSEKQLIQEYIELAHEENVDIKTIDLSLNFSALKIKEWFENKSVDDLIILDDVSEYETIKYLIPKKNCSIIITSKHITNIQTTDFNVINVSNFNEEEAQAYISNVIGREKIEKAGKETFETFIKIIGKEPLQLARIGGYIQRNKKSIKQFLDLFQEMGQQLLLQNLLPIKTISHQISEKNSDVLNDRNPLIDVKFDKSKITLEIEAYLLNLQRKLSDFIRIYELAITEEIKLILSGLLGNSFLIIKILNKTQDEVIFFDCFYSLVSHLDTVSRHLNKFLDFNSIIERGYLILTQHNLTSFSENIIYPIAEKFDMDTTVSCIVLDQKDSTENEQKRLHEQQELNEIHFFKLFLYDIWQYAIGSNSNSNCSYPSKKIYLLLNDKEFEKREEWVHIYVETFKKHLIYAGFKVYPDDLSSVSCHNNDLINNLSNIDHILMISHRNYSANFDQIISKDYRHKNKSGRFIIPILLNNVNYLSQEFKEIAELSFYKNSYPKALSSLINTLYAFDHEKFNIYWKQRLIYRKIINNTWNVPQKVKHFVGRQELLKEINNRLADKQDENKPLVITACSGMGGVGKTQLALEFINLYSHEYECVYWIDAGSEESIIASYIRLGEDKRLFNLKEELSTKDKIFIVKNWLENVAPKGWLLLYDNVDKYDNETLSKLIPVQGGKILITSRHTEWANCIMVDVFSEMEALEYVKTVLEEETIHEDVIKLINLMQRLPLALAHACAYIKYNHITITDYLAIDRIQLLSQKLELSEEKYNPVTMTWDITLERMQQELPEAVEVLYICAYFHHQNIPEYLIKTFFKKKESKFQEHKTNNTIRVISEYSMAQYDEEKNTISFHSLIQEVIRNSLEKADEKFIWTQTCLNIIHEHFMPEKKQQTAELIVHVESLLGWTDKYCPEDHYNNQYQAVADYAFGYSLEKDFIEWAQNNLIRLEKYIQNQNKDDPEKLKFYANYLIKWVNLCVSKRASSEEFNKVAMYIWDTQWEGLDETISSKLYFSAALAFMEGGKELDRSEELLQKAHKKFLMSGNESQAVECLCNLGTLYQIKKDYITALQYFEWAHILHVRSNHQYFNMAYIYNALGAIYRDINYSGKDNKVTIKYLLCSLKECESATQTTRANRYAGWAHYGLAMIYCEEKELTEAYQHYDLFIKNIKVIFPDEHKWPPSYIECQKTLYDKIADLKLEQVGIISSVSHLFESAVCIEEDIKDLEQNKIIEQCLLENGSDFEKQLETLKIFSEKNFDFPKKIYISYVSAFKNLYNDDLMRKFVQSLNNDLSLAGCQVSFGELNSNVENDLQAMINKEIQEADCIFVICNKAMKYILEHDEKSIACFEYFRYIEKHLKESNSQFVFPISFLEKNDFPNILKALPEISIYKDGYKDSLLKLIGNIYGFKHSLINFYSQQSGFEFFNPADNSEVQQDIQLQKSQKGSTFSFI